MFLYIARHAWAGHYGDPGWPDDSLRELTPEGMERYRRLVQALAERGFAPQRIATSPYARCRQTAEIIAEHASAAPGPPSQIPGPPSQIPGPPSQIIDELDALAPGSDMQAALAWADQHVGQDLCWVGHNPDVGRMTAALIGLPGSRGGNGAAIR
ncbi:MAG: histidine phosphatase family protein, partial [Planctomycetota bacterium]